MPVSTGKMADLKDEILSKIDDRFSEFKLDILAEIKQQLKIEFAEAFKNELKKREQLESTVLVLQQQLRFVRTKQKRCSRQLKSWNNIVEGYV